MTDLGGGEFGESSPPPNPGKVVVAYLHGADTAATFGQSLLGLQLHDQAHHGRLFHDGPEGSRLGLIAVPSGAGRLAGGRNLAVSTFLDRYPAADWLLCADVDMGFAADALDRLLEVADPDTRPIVGALCFAQKYAGHGEDPSPFVDWQPTVYTRTPHGFEPVFDYPRDTVAKVDGTGAAFLLIHRTVLDKLGAEGPVWFDNIETGPGSWAGEDLSFCMRATAAGFPIHVHTGVRTTHAKTIWFSEDDYLDQRQPAATAVTVVIPVADDVTAARTLIGALHAQGGYTDLLLFDTGTDPAMREWLEAQGVADVFEAPDDLPAVWNTAIDEAVARHHGHAAIVLLSPDTKVGPMYLRRLLRDGAATDALVLTAAQIAAGYRFPTDAAA